MAELKTKATTASVATFLAKADAATRKDCEVVMKLIERVTGEEPTMWGSSMVGFGRYHYRYDSGREGDYFVTGFSPRKSNLTLYIMSGFEQYPELMKKLGRHKTGKSCLYIRQISDIDLGVLETLIRTSVADMQRKDAK